MVEGPEPAGLQSKFFTSASAYLVEFTAIFNSGLTYRDASGGVHPFLRRLGLGGDEEESPPEEKK